MSPESPSVLAYSRQGHTCFISMNRPDSLNAINRELRQALTRAIHDFEADDELLVAVIAGQGGRAFSVGGDLKRVAEGMDTTSSPHRPVPRFGRMHPYDDIANCAKPVIAAIDGYCLAGGLEIALMCDIRVATESSSFGLPEPRRGMMPGPGLHHLSRMIPLGEALRLQLTGGRMSASRAYQIGLVQEIATDREELFEKVQEMSDEIAQCAPMAVQGIKKVVRRGRDLPVEQSWLLAEPAQEKLARSPAAREGINSFTQKRDPHWHPEELG